jgi:hypothetical protein
MAVTKADCPKAVAVTAGARTKPEDIRQGVVARYGQLPSLLSIEITHRFFLRLCVVLEMLDEALAFTGIAPEDAYGHSYKGLGIAVFSQNEDGLFG